MARKHFRIKKYKHPALKFVVRSKVTGKWERRFFKTEAEAKTYAAQKEIELLNQGTEGMNFPAELRVMAQQAANQLAQYNKTIRDAVAFYLKYLETESRSIPVKQAVDELIQNRQAAGLSTVYLRDLKYRLGRFSDSFRERSVANITTKEIVAWLESLGVGAVTRNTFRRDVRTLFSFSREHGYCAENPVASRATLAKERAKDVEVLSVEEARKLIAAASPGMLPYWVLGLFAGLRPSEIRKLQWSDCDFEHALITVRSAKTGRKRYVTMQPNLVQWLGPYRCDDGKVVDPVNFRRQYALDREAAGLNDWPVNCLRHSFGSYWLAQFSDINALALQMGNSPAVIEEHYRQAVRPRDARRFWAIIPSGASSSSSKVVSISA
jgi:integrase